MVNEDNKISWVTLKSEPERPDEIIVEEVIPERTNITFKQNELGGEDDDESI